MNPSTKNTTVTTTTSNTNNNNRKSNTSPATVYANRYRFTDLDELGYYPELVPDCDEDIAGIVGPQADIDALIRRYRRELVRAARRCLDDPQHAEDLVQDLCVEALSGYLRLPVDPESAAEMLHDEIVERCAAWEGDGE
ncbi:MAG TPA: sigma factor [Polyangiaceae bacterium]|jgi:hypothetical protein